VMIWPIIAKQRSQNNVCKLVVVDFINVKNPNKTFVKGAWCGFDSAQPP